MNWGGRGKQYSLSIFMKYLNMRHLDTQHVVSEVNHNKI